MAKSAHPGSRGPADGGLRHAMTRYGDKDDDDEGFDDANSAEGAEAEDWAAASRWIGEEAATGLRTSADESATGVAKLSRGRATSPSTAEGNSATEGTEGE